MAGTPGQNIYRHSQAQRACHHRHVHQASTPLSHSLPGCHTGATRTPAPPARCSRPAAATGTSNANRCRRGASKRNRAPPSSVKHIQSLIEGRPEAGPAPKSSKTLPLPVPAEASSNGMEHMDGAPTYSTCCGSSSSSETPSVATSAPSLTEEKVLQVHSVLPGDRPPSSCGLDSIGCPVAVEGLSPVYGEDGAVWLVASDSFNNTAKGSFIAACATITNILSEPSPASLDACHCLVSVNNMGDGALPAASSLQQPGPQTIKCMAPCDSQNGMLDHDAAACTALKAKRSLWGRVGSRFSRAMSCCRAPAVKFDLDDSSIALPTALMVDCAGHHTSSCTVFNGKGDASAAAAVRSFVDRVTFSGSGPSSWLRKLSSLRSSRKDTAVAGGDQ